MSVLGGHAANAAERPSAAHAAERPSAGVVPPVAVNKGGALLAEAFKGDSSALSRLNRPKGTPKTAPRSAKEAQLEAKKKAVQRNQRSYWDAEQAGTGANATPENSLLSAGSAPPEPDTSECLAREDSNRLDGVTLNRSLWCIRYRLGTSFFRVQSGGIPVYVGQVTMEFTGVAVGRRDARTMVVYYKAVPGSVDYDLPTEDRAKAPAWGMTIGADCSDTSCSRIGNPIYKTWAHWNTDDTWWSWDITSDETASNNPDDVLHHGWYFAFEGSGSEYIHGGARTAERIIRCDSATYFKFGQTTYPKACINAEVIPHLQYSTTSEAHGAVAEHIQTAQNEPHNTWPITYLPKRIPGKFTGDINDPGLHRVAPESANYSDNEKERLAACNRTGNYDAITGMPPYTTATHDCDEYPFRITVEGAASPDWDFSVRAVPLSQNRSAGSSLNVYVVSDRILYDYDEFWVEIIDGTSGGGGGSGGGDPSDTEPPSITCPPDVTSTSITPDLGQPTTSDNVDPTVTVTSDAPSAFPYGTSIVTWRAVDDSGNVATCTQRVSIRFKFTGFYHEGQYVGDYDWALNTAPTSLTLGFRLTNYADNPITSPSVITSVAWDANPDPGYTIEEPVFNATTGRFEIRTSVPKGFNDNARTFTVNLTDGSSHSVVIDFQTV
ncbi:NucA/NucB deoxyribonuclease domain-containing protein [Micromonospora sp. NPDC000018]|uniref:NucA/NucB deoxyribonuclease domain-containing protein n=1 Tax=Micromonospora sp. NPDC000018 TaxID=3154239 RepID=UPI003319FA67